MKGGKKFWKSGRKNILIGCILITYLCYTIYAFVANNSVRISRQYEYQLKENGEQVADEIYGRMEDALTTVESLAETYCEYADIHSPDALAQLVRVSEKTNFTRMWLTKLDGAAVSSEGITSDASGREYLEDASKGNSGISKVQESRVNGEKNVVIYAPIYHNETISGMLIGIFALEQLSDVIDMSYFDGRGGGKIFDRNGTVLVQSADDIAVAEDNNLLSFLNSVDMGQKEGVDAIRANLSQGKASGFVYTADGIKHHGYYCSIGINDWFMYVSLPDEIIVDYTTENVREAVVLCINFAIVVVLALAFRYREKSKALERQAQLDGLTGILNRGALQEQIKKALLDEKQGVCAVMVMDVDKFKLVNDTFGHLAGDDILIQIGQLMRDRLWSDCVYGRFGGDEFLVMVPRVTDKDMVYQEEKNFAEAVTKLRLPQYPSAAFSVSIGIAFSDQDGGDFKTLFEEADARMYQDKKRINVSG